MRHLGREEILVQESSGLLLHGPVGERVANHYSFYAAFATEDEYRLVSSSRVIGSLAVTHMLLPGQHIVFGGKTWRVEDINDRDKTIVATKSRGGKPPAFAGDGGRIHNAVRQRMREILRSDTPLPFLDRQARQLLTKPGKPIAGKTSTTGS